MIILMIVVTGCLEPYNPPEITDDVNILVVDGMLNATDSSGHVMLSKAVPLSHDGELQTVSGAFVQIEEENGPNYVLNETGPGIYTLTKMALSLAKRYRLGITISNDSKYYSDFITLEPTPEIDSITWRSSPQQPGLDIFVNTHDASRRSKYYRWLFEETWAYRSTYGSMYKIVNGQVVANEVNASMCYHHRPSTEIHVGSTIQLADDVIRNFPLIFIPVRSQRVSVKYSILVKQQTLTREAYNFWTQLKKSTESLGGLFDPMPSQVLGNMHSENDASEPVLGYFSGGQTSVKRIFLDHRDLPSELQINATPNCQVDSIELAFVRNMPNMLLIGSYGSPFVEGYYTSQGPNCMDCRDDGGVLQRPDFWK